MTSPTQSRPLRCEEVRERLTLFVGADLPAAERTSVDVHLAGCLSCYRESKRQAEALEAVHSVAFAGADMPRGASFVDDILGEIHGPPPARTGWWLRVTAISGWAAALVLGFALWSSDSVGADAGPVESPKTRLVNGLPAKHPDDRGKLELPDEGREKGEEGLEVDDGPGPMLVHRY